MSPSLIITPRGANRGVVNVVVNLSTETSPTGVQRAAGADAPGDRILPLPGLFPKK